MNQGKLNAMILAMLPDLNSGNKVYVIGCKDPIDITNRLKEKGIEVSWKPIFASRPLKPVYNLHSLEGEILTFEGGSKIQTGFMFYCSPKPDPLKTNDSNN